MIGYRLSFLCRWTGETDHVGSEVKNRILPCLEHGAPDLDPVIFSTGPSCSGAGPPSPSGHGHGPHGLGPCHLGRCPSSTNPGPGSSGTSLLDPGVESPGYSSSGLGPLSYDSSFSSAGLGASPGSPVSCPDTGCQLSGCGKQKLD